MPSARVAFEYPNFRYYQAARFLAITAAEMQSVAVGWQIYDLTHRALDLGLVGLFQFLPGFFLFLLAGHTADRLPRRRIILLCYAAFAVCSALLFAVTFRGVAAPHSIYFVLLLIGIVRAFNGPASQAFLPLLLPEEHFPNAVAWASSIFQAATILGPAMGGLVYAVTGGAHAVYAIAAAEFLLATALVAIIRVRAIQRPRGADLSTLLAGLRYLWHTKVVLGAISLDLFAVLLGGAVALLPLYAREILHVGPRGLGWLRSAPGVGAILTALLLAHYPLRRRAGPIMLWCVAGFGVFTIVFGLSRSFTLSLLSLLLVGALDMVSVNVRATIIQLTTPDDMRGRVSAVNMLFIGASNEFGQFESGITAEWFGAVRAIVLGGLGTLLVVALYAWRFPSLRQVDSLAPDRGPTTIPEQPAITADPNE